MTTSHSWTNTSFPINAKLLYEQSLQCTKILSTGCQCLDVLLDGGLWTGELVEICGVPGSGKTQFCLTTCANLIAKTDGSVLYIDASGSFVCERFLEILAAQKGQCTPQFLGKDVREEHRLISFRSLIKFLQDALPRMQHLRIFDAMSLLAELKTIERKLVCKMEFFYCQMKLLILDSITPLISPILGGGQTQGHMLMMEIGRILKRLAFEHNIVTVVVNGVVMDREPESRLEHKPALGKSWKIVPHKRLYFEPIENRSPGSKLCRAVLTKSSRQAIGQFAMFTITRRGLES